MDLVLPGESSARIKAVGRTRQILFLILPRRAERLEINRASVLGLRAIGGGHSAASKFFSFLGLALEKELNRASRGVKEWKFSNGELNCSLEDVNSNKKFVSVTCYLSKSYC